MACAFGFARGSPSMISDPPLMGLDFARDDDRQATVCPRGFPCAADDGMT